jgi:hypothetical protein
LENF